MASCSAANYTGLCIPSMKYVDQGVIKEAAISSAFKTHQAYVQLNNGGSLIDYRSLEDFKKANLDCCILSSTGREGHRSTFLERTRGVSRGFVRVRYRDGVGSIRDIYFAVTNCGVLWNGTR